MVWVLTNISSFRVFLEECPGLKDISNIVRTYLTIQAHGRLINMFWQRPKVNLWTFAHVTV